MHTEPSFYELADRLHAELVNYYGGEFPYFMAVVDTRTMQLKKDMATFFNPNPEKSMNALAKALVSATAMTYGLSQPEVLSWRERFRLWLTRKIDIGVNDE